MSPARHLVDLDTATAVELLASVPVGRLVWNGSAGLTAIPVNHVWRDGRVLVRTTAYSTIARECDDQPVAFEVDALDEDHRIGWSVLVRGRASIDWDAGPASAPTDPWPDGLRPLVLAIDVASLDGRRLVEAG
ncbi:pyridoxamine 5'-phosphate oxidase family protein [Nocardioides massiliensis]|uniref:Nitroimidazol reductase NimA-like FMN-containing flavoprotein (Pyridoxamine 5'-phosphate oxidase superfamily) n=1 Tax=Nocardioides massiliensis TaxID=1325935 RepID=A0ABT9NU18_9ACTN|nr:pyridoxamine 5'-phosphate oxidase family protein [Nocardioides massiliensis]MDP9823909.1 nitroimidazol reductase NimA-like FMN-containing flavoprotein (pyridoxamine 5'-phosphate oxidase superfamily) [Nocardioides massiliensis]